MHYKYLIPILEMISKENKHDVPSSVLMFQLNIMFVYDDE